MGLNQTTIRTSRNNFLGEMDGYPYLRECSYNPCHLGIEICDPEGNVLGLIERINMGDEDGTQDAWVVYLNDGSYADKEWIYPGSTNEL